jgi:hypothetical protein
MGADDEIAEEGSAPRPLAREALGRRRRRDAALILPLAGAFLLVSPLLDVFAAGSLFGVPTAVIYVFAVWAGLIVAAGALARRLIEDGGDG